MLTLPMKDKHGYMIGAIQLIHKCRHRKEPVITTEAADDPVIPFRQSDLNSCLSLTSQVSVALQNAQYEQEIKNLFEGFIKASVGAIEARDPTTSGHSQRVGAYSVELAEAVSRTEKGTYQAIRLGEARLRELRYASLLHDFRKIDVREPILTKAKKLHPDKLRDILRRSNLRVPLFVPFLLRSVTKGFRSVGLSCVIPPNSAPSPALATKRMNSGALKR
jgi:response regulator RpfG family c-di-GMP phosphodiesterase